jgi:hypothetical protein
MALDLTDDEKTALIELLHGTVDRDRSLTSPRIRKLQAILEKLALEPPEPPRPTASRPDAANALQVIVARVPVLAVGV